MSSIDSDRRFLDRLRESAPYGALIGLYFLVVCAVGILRPIKNALALDGLGATDFYKVYIVSALVVLFVPIYTRLADRYSWRWIVPGVAIFFALNLVLFRFLYVPGSAVFGLVFYGWYDLFAAALVTQFFVATQLYLNTRTAKRAYPLIIAGGSLGATLGGAITGFSAGIVGTPNLLLVAAALIALFGLAIPLVLRDQPPEPSGRTLKPKERSGGTSFAEAREIFGHRQVQLIALTVLLTIVVKQLIDYQFNVITKEVFDSRDAISAFQGKFNAATQWLPIVVLAVLRPGLQRWGVGVAVLLLPVFMIAANLALAVLWGLWVAAAAKGAENSLRYSAERTGREILYVPVPDNIKLKAKAYIDVAVEKGIGKAVSALAIFLLLQFVDYRQLAYVGVIAAAILLGLVLAVRREYVRTLARSIEGRFASFRGGFATLMDASSRPVVHRALAGDAPLQTAFALDLIEQISAQDAASFVGDFEALTEHASPEIRERALNLLAKVPAAADPARIRHCLIDPVPAVRTAAVRALARSEGEDVLEELLGSEDGRARTAALTYLSASDGTDRPVHQVGPRYLESRWNDPKGGVEARIEVALAAGVSSPGAGAEGYLETLLNDPHVDVRATALRSAGRLRYVPAYQRMVAGLGTSATREAARDALVSQGPAIVPLLATYLHDPEGEPVIRRNIPAVLSRIVQQEAVDALIVAVLAPETDQLLDYRALKALSKLRAVGADLHFPNRDILAIAEREVEAAELYRASRNRLTAESLAGAGASCGPPFVCIPVGPEHERTAARLDPIQGGEAVVTAVGGEIVIPGLVVPHPLPQSSEVARLLEAALNEGIVERREGLFRCLGLLYDHDGVYDAYTSVSRGSPAAQANGLEWLERTLGHGLYSALAPLLDPTAPPSPTAERPVSELIAVLRQDGDPWVARCARALDWTLQSPPTPESPEETPMHLIEKVFLLQRIDLLRGARGSHLSLLASIAEDSEVAAGTTLIQKGHPADALYVVRQGSLSLEGGSDRLDLEEGAAIGTWSLIDESPSPYEARATRTTQLLRIDRRDFQDLLADHPELALGLLQGLARRVRSLVA